MRLSFGLGLVSVTFISPHCWTLDTDIRLARFVLVMLYTLCMFD